MKKFICLLLILSITLGGFIMNAAAEESSVDDITTDVSVPDVSVPDVSVPDVSVPEVSVPDDSSEPSDSSEPNDSSVDVSGDSSEPTEECAVTVTADPEGGNVYGWREDVVYYVGETLSLKITPLAKKGVKSVTVNGEALDVSVNGGNLDIELTEAVMDIVIEFADTVKVIIDCGLGGTFSVDGRKDVVNGSNFSVIVGSDVVIRISPNANQTLDTIKDNGETVTRSYTYVIREIDTQHSIVISFRETGGEDIETFSITVRAEGNGTVYPDGVIQVEKGASLVLELTPDSGYVIKSVTDRNNTYAILGNTYTVKDVYSDGTVIVTFGKENDSQNESKPDNGDTSSPSVPDSNVGYITRAEVEAAKKGNEVFINIAQKSKIGADALSYINELTKNGAVTVSVGVSGSYSWILPKNTDFNVIALAKDGIDFGINLDKGAASIEMKKALEGKVNSAVFNIQNNLTVERLSSAALPAGTRLELSLGAYGETYGWFKYEINGNVSPAYESAGALVAVASDGCVTVDMPSPQIYGVLVSYMGETANVTVKWDSNACDLSVLGNTVYGENGECTTVIPWQYGVDFSVNVSVKSGYAIESISSSHFADMTLLGYGVDVTAVAAKGEKGTVEMKIPAISKGGVITVKTAESSSRNTSSPGGKTPWDIIILIAVIVIAMIAGGVVFVVKWRQSDDEDDDDDYEDDEDDE